MKYKILIIFFFIISCSTNYTKLENKIPYNAKGFAYIYNDEDLEKKLISGKLDNTKIQVSNNKLGVNTLIKVINPKTNDSIVVKNTKRINFPDFYKILMTEEAAKKLNIDKEKPFVEIIEIKKNKSFVAKKAKIFQEEKKISSNAPITSVTISNISKNKINKNNNKTEKMYIMIASFYSEDTAKFLKKRIIKEIPDYDNQKLLIKKKSNKEINLISGPYNAINLMKNDYILLKNFGFEELDITINE